MKSFNHKFVICERDENGQAVVSIFGEDRRGNRVPLLLDTKVEAVIEIADHMRLTAEAVQRGDMPEDRLDELGGDFVANCSNKGGIFTIWIEGEYEPEFVYVGTYDKFVVSLN